MRVDWKTHRRDVKRRTQAYIDRKLSVSFGFASKFKPLAFEAE